MKTPDLYFMDIAKRTAYQSRCLSRKCGSVIVLENDIVSVGFNGPPKNFPNPGTKEFIEIIVKKYNFDYNQQQDFYLNKKCPRRVLEYKSGENTNYCPCSHAEQNSINNAAKLGRSTKNTSIYVWAEIPICMNCANSIVGAGINEVIIDNTGNYESEGFSGIEILNYCGINVRKPNYVYKEN